MRGKRLDGENAAHITLALPRWRMRPITLLFLLWTTAGIAGTTEVPPSCQETATTQTDMNICAEGGLKKADAQLNAVYQAVLSRHGADKAFIQNLRAAQRAWLAWRDAEMKAIFPDREPGYYGSVFPMCWSSQLEQLTQERAKQLQMWLNGVPEGEVCGVGRAQR